MMGSLVHLLNSKIESCVSPLTAIFEMCPRFWQSTLVRKKFKLNSRKAGNWGFGLGLRLRLRLRLKLGLR